MTIKDFSLSLSLMTPRPLGGITWFKKEFKELNELNFEVFSGVVWNYPPSLSKILSIFSSVFNYVTQIYKFDDINCWSCKNVVAKS